MSYGRQGFDNVIDPATIDHGLLSGLLDDDHPQYLLVDGSRAMSGDLDLGNNDLINPGTGHDAFTDYVANEHIDWTNATDDFFTTGEIRCADDIYASTEELIDDPSFDTPSDWVQPDGWTVSGGAAVWTFHPSGVSSLTETSPFTVEVGESYYITVVISAITSTVLEISLGGVTESTPFATPGTYTYLITASNANQLALTPGNVGSGITITDISVVKAGDVYAKSFTSYGTSNFQSLNVDENLIVGYDERYTGTLKIYGKPWEHSANAGQSSILELWTGRTYGEGSWAGVPPADHYVAGVIQGGMRTVNYTMSDTPVIAFMATADTGAPPFSPKIWIHPSTGILGVLDNGGVTFGTGFYNVTYPVQYDWLPDAEIIYNGSYWDFDIPTTLAGASACTAVRFNQNNAPTDFEVYAESGIVLKIESNPAGDRFGMWGAAPIAQPTIVGAKGGNVALTNLLTALANMGLLIDNTT